jgi:hypothetical protein
MLRWGSVVTIVFAQCAFAGFASAQPSDHVLGAEALFQAGRQDVARRDYVSARAKFDESYKLDPAVGTLINLADCEEHLGHLAAAWHLWREAAEQLAHNDERRPVVMARRDGIDARVPRLTIRIPSGAPGTARVQRNGVEVPRALLDVPVPIDPGPTSLELAVPGRLPTRRQVQIAEAARETVELELGQPDTTAPTDGVNDVVAIPVAPGSPSALTRTSPAVPDTASKFPARLLGFVTLGAGGAALAVGAVTGGMAIAKHTDLEKECGKVCGPEQESERQRYYTLGTLSTVGFIAGGVLAAGGAVLVLTAPKPISSAVGGVVVGPGYLGAKGTF